VSRRSSLRKNIRINCEKISLTISNAGSRDLSRNPRNRFVKKLGGIKRIVFYWRSPPTLPRQESAPEAELLLKRKSQLGREYSFSGCYFFMGVI
jgi:hypothetical protein